MVYFLLFMAVFGAVASYWLRWIFVFLVGLLIAGSAAVGFAAYGTEAVHAAAIAGAGFVVFQLGYVLTGYFSETQRGGADGDRPFDEQKNPHEAMAPATSLRHVSRDDD